MIFAIIIFLITYAIIVSEKWDRTIVALCGGILMLVTFNDPKEALKALDYDTLALLISMMVIVMIIRRTGIFEYLSIKLVKISKGEPWKILVYLSLITAFASACLDNVTTILLVLPIVLDITKELKLKPIPFVVSQIFASNIGGTSTLVGDPPNMMMASKGNLVFMDFIYNVAPVTLPILAISIVSFIFIYKKNFKTSPENKMKVLALNENEAIKDKKLLVKSLVILGLTIAGFIVLGLIHYPSSIVAIAGASLLLLITGVSSEKVFKEVEWKTIFFFAGLFMLVGGLENMGVLKLLAEKVGSLTGGNPVLLVISILWVSALASAFVDNIPFTLAMIPVIQTIADSQGIPIAPMWWALSLGACLGGNGTIIGASANVVATGMLEEMGHKKLTFIEYFKVAFPLMIISIVICTVYLIVFYL